MMSDRANLIERSMRCCSLPPAASIGARSRRALAREITAVICFKLLALALIYAFFVEPADRTRLSASAVERHLLAPTATRIRDHP